MRHVGVDSYPHLWYNMTMHATPTIGGIMHAVTLAPCRASASPVNPNAGKRKPGSNVRKPRTSGPRSTVTITRVDPSYLARYGSERAQAAADRAQRTGKPAAGNATVVTRSATTRTLRKAAAAKITL